MLVSALCRYVVYIDGQLAGQLPLAGPNITADGGGPIPLSTADIFLCSRSDGEQKRYFHGSITHLALWSSALSPAQVLGCRVCAREGRPCPSSFMRDSRHAQAALQ